MLHPAPSISRGASLWSLATDYLALAKPPIVLLLVLTAVGAMFMAAQGLPSLSTTLLVVVGGSLAAGGANALNHYLDRDIDQRMTRTRNRPLPGNRIKPRRALAFGMVTNVIAFVVLAEWVNLLSALLTLSATAFYVMIYTQWLKRSTTQNIVIGGAAGAIPPMVGWAAVTGEIGLPAIYLFAIVFFWTPPHFWALALLIKDDYAKADIPMLPVVVGVAETARSIMLYSVLLVMISVLFFTIEGLGWIYFAGAMALGILLLKYSWALLQDPTIKRARSLYLYTILYLALLFGIIAIDSAM